MNDISKIIPSSDYSFISDVLPVKFRTAVITGACRSGKTTLGNLLATAKDVDHADEPWTPLMLPIMSGLGMLETGVARDMFVSSVAELYNEMVHLRNANFRINDLSSIYSQKECDDIYYRLTQINTRQDVRDYVESADPLCLLNLAETSPFMSFFFDAIKQCNVILVLRRAEGVACDCSQKEWYSDAQLLQPNNRIVYRRFNYKETIWYLPWWVTKGDEEAFVGYSDYERCLYYWCQFTSWALSEVSKNKNSGKLMIVRYENLHEKPRDVFSDVAKLLNLEPTPLTEKIIQKIEKYDAPSKKMDLNISDHLRERVERINGRLEY